MKENLFPQVFSFVSFVHQGTRAALLYIRKKNKRKEIADENVKAKKLKENIANFDKCKFLKLQLNLSL